MTDLGSILGEAVTVHRDGKISEAEKLYQAILEHSPENPDVNHNMGIIHLDQEEYEKNRQLKLGSNTIPFRNNAVSRHSYF